MVLLSCSHRALSGQRADRVPAAYEGLAEERSGDAVRARRGQQPADREAEAQGENRRLVDLSFILFTINCHHFRRQSQTQMFQVS